MPAEKVKNNTEATVNHMDSLLVLGSNRITTHTNKAQTGPGSTDLQNHNNDADNQFECPYCNGEDVEPESGQRSCQHWTQVGRSSSTRQAHRKKSKVVSNGHPESIRYGQNRSFRGVYPVQRVPDEESLNRSTLRDTGENPSSAVTYRPKVDKPSPQNHRSAISSVAESNKSNASSPAPSISSELVNGHESNDKRSYPRYTHKPPRSFKVNGQAVDLDQSGSFSRPSVSPLPISNGSTRSNVRQSNNWCTGNAPVQSCPLNTSYKFCMGDQWRRQSNNESWRRHHHTLPFAPRNQNNFQKYNSPGSHPSRPHHNTFARNRVVISGASDSQTPQTSPRSNESCCSGANLSVENKNKTYAQKESDYLSTHRTSWAAAVAAAVESPKSTCHCTAEPSHIQLVDFLLNQWHCFMDHKSS